MRYISLFILAVFSASLIGCAAKIDRYGYTTDELQEVDPSTCNIFIKENMEIDKNKFKVLGGIKASDTQFSTDCDELYVLTLFAKEACALQADIINITEEQQPNIWSSCYRAKAEFLQLNDKSQVSSIESDPKYKLDLVMERSKDTHRRTSLMMGGGALGAFLGGPVQKSDAPKDDQTNK